MGKATTSRAVTYTSRKAIPPYSLIRYGTRAELPMPSADPQATARNAGWLDQ